MFPTVCTFFFVSGISLGLSDISKVGVNGPALFSECDLVVRGKSEGAEKVNAATVWWFLPGYAPISTKAVNL